MTELARALSGNICRCTGYAGIIRAVRAAAAYCNAQGTDAESGSISR
ncbi:2Fe-2S iron-sulfur cluster-binding protein [Chelatococcus asaccharovorans]|nr:hypothetical protein [Chelatococcus asaccharovorans]